MGFGAFTTMLEQGDRLDWFNSMVVCVLALVSAVVLGFVAVVLAIIFAPAPDVWPDDAYVTAHYATVAPRVSGQIVSVEVDDNQPVSAG